jgi:SAM-dependent methyltransferase
VGDPERSGRERDLAAYYDGEVRERAGRGLPPDRVRRRDEFIRLLAAERRRSVVEIGAGPGRDGTAFVAAGLAYSGVDLAPASVAACRAAGLDAHVASVHELPFADGTFAAGWSMSTLLHVADVDLDAALAEVVRVLVPGAPLAIGLWGAEEDTEGVHGPAVHGPARFFSFRTDERVRAALARHGTIERWLTSPGPGDGHYQFAVVRTPRLSPTP